MKTDRRPTEKRYLTRLNAFNREGMAEVNAATHAESTSDTRKIFQGPFLRYFALVEDAFSSQKHTRRSIYRHF